MWALRRKTRPERCSIASIEGSQRPEPHRSGTKQISTGKRYRAAVINYTVKRKPRSRQNIKSKHMQGRRQVLLPRTSRPWTRTFTIRRAVTFSTVFSFPCRYVHTLKGLCLLQSDLLATPRSGSTHVCCPYDLDFPYLPGLHRRFLRYL